MARRPTTPWPSIGCRRTRRRAGLVTAWPPVRVDHGMGRSSGSLTRAEQSMARAWCQGWGWGIAQGRRDGQHSVENMRPARDKHGVIQTRHRDLGHDNGTWIGGEAHRPAAADPAPSVSGGPLLPGPALTRSLTKTHPAVVIRRDCDSAGFLYLLTA
jgi:hypothetical protein